MHRYCWLGLTVPIYAMPGEPAFLFFPVVQNAFIKHCIYIYQLYLSDNNIDSYILYMSV